MTTRKADSNVLRATKAREIMQTDLVTLSTQDPISAAISTFEEYHITGAPVVDASGVPVGVLSVADIARSDHVQGGRLEAARYEYYFANPLEEQRDDSLFGDEEIFAKADYSDDVAGENRVGEWMTSKVISVDPDDDLVKVCAVMAKENIHRVLVTEESGVLGLISTFDIVRFLALKA